MPTDKPKRIDTDGSNGKPLGRYERIYVGFRSKGVTPKIVTRWLPFLNVSFGHCYILWKTESGWLYIDPLFHGMFIKELPQEQGPQFIVDTSDDKMLEFKCPDAEEQFHWHPWIGMLSCVTFSKYIIGIKSWKIITPYQLWKRLIKDGATEIKKQEKDNGMV